MAFKSVSGYVKTRQRAERSMVKLNQARSRIRHLRHVWSLVQSAEAAWRERPDADRLHAVKHVRRRFTNLITKST
jgi:hypothetical protein